MITLIIILQIISIILCTTGIIIEYFYESHWGFLLITAASLVFAAVTKLFELQLYDENRQLKLMKGINDEKRTMDTGKTCLRNRAKGVACKGD